MEEADKPVWVWTPESTEPMQAGTFSLKSGVRTTGVFSYSKEYIAASDAFALDPLHLPFSSRLTARSRHKDGLFGCLRDACPEGYGRDMLIHRYGLQSNPDPLTLLEVSPGDGVGAIEVCENIQQKMDFRAPVAQRLLELMADLPPERHSSRAVHQLLDVGTSMGGERPKTTVQHDGALWLAKLQDRGDAPHMPAREFAAMQLAQMCGIRASRTALHTVGERREVLFVKRFDRADLSGKRVPYLSANTLLGLDIDAMRGDKARSYLVLADRARQIGVPAEDIKEIWRRMAFNALVHNVDDHPRNHGFILDG
nr:type II toxin-antitoxin system HipA family toxin [Pseudomonas sp.]